MEIISTFSGLLIVIIAFGGYFVVIERRLTKIETTLSFLHEKIEALVKKLDA